VEGGLRVEGMWIFGFVFTFVKFLLLCLAGLGF